MNKEETQKILSLIYSVFPLNNTQSREEASFTIETWRSLFPEPYEQVLPAVKHCLQNSKFRPVPATIREVMYKQSDTGTSAEEAWNTARSFWSNIGSDNAWEIEEEWRQLPEEIRRIYTSADMVELGFHTSSKDITAFEKPRFIARYNEIMAEKKQKAIAGVIEQPQMIEQDEKPPLTYRELLDLKSKEAHGTLTEEEHERLERYESFRKRNAVVRR